MMVYADFFKFIGGGGAGRPVGYFLLEDIGTISLNSLFGPNNKVLVSVRRKKFVAELKILAESRPRFKITTSISKNGKQNLGKLKKVWKITFWEVPESFIVNPATKTSVRVCRIQKKIKNLQNIKKLTKGRKVKHFRLSK